MRVVAFGLVLAAGCTGSEGSSNAPPGNDPVQPTLTTKRGGEIRLEWIARDKMTTARMGAFFYKAPPKPTPFPAFPGCVDTRVQQWPLPGATPLDVGGVTVVPHTGTPFELLRATNTTDSLGRLHELWWYKPAAFAEPGDADTFLPPNESYDIVLAGSAEWPHEVHVNAAFMPERWIPTTPNMEETIVLTKGQDLTVTYAPVVSSNLPVGSRVNNYILFERPPLGPIVVCKEEGTDGVLQVPAAMVDVIIDTMGPTARVVRQHEVVRSFEMDDGIERKSVEVISSYSYSNALTAAP